MKQYYLRATTGSDTRVLLSGLAGYRCYTGAAAAAASAAAAAAAAE